MIEHVEISLTSNTQTKWQRFLKRCHELIVVEKLLNVYGILFLLITSLLLAFLITKLGIVFGILFTLVCVALPVMVALVIYPKIGIIMYLTLSFCIMFLLRYGITFPLGTLMDGMLVLFIIGLFIQQKQRPNWQVFKSPMTTWLLVWIIYNMLQIENPTADSRLAWVYTIRGMALVAMMYFIFVYNINDKQFIRFIIKWWLGFMVIAALYAAKQEFIGFTDFEEAYNNSEGVPLLLFIAGHWRKYSVFSDPVTFAYNMAIASLFCIALISGPIKKYQKAILIIVTVTLLSNMLFSGTRGAFPLVPAGLMLYAILKLSKKIIVFSIIAAIFFVGLIIMPTSNQNILRFQSAFTPNNDPSYIVRKLNQARIKPYIWSHPIGGGLGSVGEWGKKFSPGSYLSNFPPDSGYVRTTVELGPIGLFIFCALMFTILKTGIDNYYKIKDLELKSYCLGAVIMIFTWNVANFPQEALVQYPSNVIFYLTVALINITLRLDKEQQNKLIHAA